MFGTLRNEETLSGFNPNPYTRFILENSMTIDTIDTAHLSIYLLLYIPSHCYCFVLLLLFITVSIIKILLIIILLIITNNNSNYYFKYYYYHHHYYYYDDYGIMIIYIILYRNIFTCIMVFPSIGCPSVQF